MRLVIANCTVDYSGRLDAHLSEAVRLIMIKADGCISVHAAGGAYKPLNWMNAPNNIHESTDDDDELTWLVTNEKNEKLTIKVHELISDFSQDMGIDPGLQKDGVEAHLQELLAANVDKISDGMVLVRREYPTDIGPVDLLCRDSRGEAVAIEIKRRGDGGGTRTARWRNTRRWEGRPARRRERRNRAILHDTRVHVRRTRRHTWRRETHTTPRCRARARPAHTEGQE